MKKNVGILTFHNSNHNFGAVLQTYALYTLIKQLGYEANIINYHTQELSLKEKIFSLKVKVLGYRFERFRKKHIPNILSPTNSDKRLQNLNKHLDIFVVGSDQVWRYTKKHKHLKRYFFDFVESDKIKISYAPSFGIDTWDGPESFRIEIEKLIKTFKAISVREEEGIQICKEKFDVSASSVLDPTLLLQSSDYENIFSKQHKSCPKSDYLAYMILDDSNEILSYFQNNAAKQNLDFIEIKGKKLKFLPKIILFNSISKWLYYMKNAHVVVTDSFHCVIFSIIFKRDFICLVNQKRGVSRLHNLLEIVGLENRFFSTVEEIDANILSKHIDYEIVDRKLKSKQEKSIRFLKDALDSE